MYEVGNLAHQAGWQTFVIQADFTAVNFFLAHIEEDKPCLLIFDYIEESESFEEVARYLVKNKREGQIKLLGNCRKSYTKLELAPLNFRV